MYYLKHLVLNNNYNIPGGSAGKESACNVGDLGSSLGSCFYFLVLGA